jgi:hypothetical protein
VRTHVSLGKDAPCTRQIEQLGPLLLRILFSADCTIDTHESRFRKRH